MSITGTHQHLERACSTSSGCSAGERQGVAVQLQQPELVQRHPRTNSLWSITCGTPADRNIDGLRESRTLVAEVKSGKTPDGRVTFKLTGLRSNPCWNKRGDKDAIGEIDADWIVQWLMGPSSGSKWRAVQWSQKPQPPQGGAEDPRRAPHEHRGLAPRDLRGAGAHGRLSPTSPARGPVPERYMRSGRYPARVKSQRLM